MRRREMMRFAVSLRKLIDSFAPTYGERTMTARREMTIHYMDGSKMKLDFPVQTASESAQVIKLKEALAGRHVVVEADGALLIIPFENIKYIQAYPAPARLPENAIRAASFTV